MKTIANRFLSAALVAVGASATLASAQSGLFVAPYQFTPTNLYSMSTANGSTSVVGATGFDAIGDLASDPSTGRIWGTRRAQGSTAPSNQLLGIDPVTGAVGSVVNMNAPSWITSLAFNPVTGVLYGNTTVGFGATADALYSIDPATGACTFVGAIGFSNIFALGFDNAGNLYGISDNTGQLLSINTGSGAGSAIGNTGSFFFDLACDPATGTMYSVRSSLGLYTVDLTTGAATLVGSAGDGLNYAGAAFIPAPGVAGLLALGGLAAARRRR